MILERIEGPWDVKKLTPEQMKTLAAEIRLGCGSSVLYAQDSERTQGDV